MNITFLVGNGFDLSLGINTSYEKFYDWYCNKQSMPGKEDSDAIKQFKEEIKNREQNENWSDLELALGEYTSEFTLDDVDSYIECYEDVHNQIIEFIKQSEQKYNCNVDMPKDFSDFGNGILNFYQELSPRENTLFDNLMKEDRPHNSTISFISFNYTNTLDTYIQGLVKEKKTLKEWNYNRGVCSIKVLSDILHIHGTLNLYPVLGVGDEQDVSNKDLLQNPIIRDSLLKRNHINYIGQTWYDEAVEIIDNSKIICIFGMSLGRSDSPWWKKIMDWLSQTQSIHLIVFWHSSISESSVSIMERRNVREPIKEKLMAYCSASPEEASEISERIHIVINTKKVLVTEQVDLKNA